MVVGDRPVELVPVPSVQGLSEVAGDVLEDVRVLARRGLDAESGEESLGVLP
jgi:hypothetical protein